MLCSPTRFPGRSIAGVDRASGPGSDFPSRGRTPRMSGESTVQHLGFFRRGNRQHFTLGQPRPRGRLRLERFGLHGWFGRTESCAPGHGRSGISSQGLGSILARSRIYGRRSDPSRTTAPGSHRPLSRLITPFFCTWKFDQADPGSPVGFWIHGDGSTAKSANIARCCSSGMGRNLPVASA